MGNNLNSGSFIRTNQRGVANGVASLDSNGKVPVSQLPAGDLSYQGLWNASTNTPTLTSSVGTQGFYYIVSVAGTTNLNGITDWSIGDWALFNGSVWQKIDQSNLVTSVFGRTGGVIAAAGDYTASQVTNVPAGSIAAITVQAAINELNSDTTDLIASLGSAAYVSTSTFDAAGSAAAALVDANDYTDTQIAALGLGNISTQNVDDVFITGGVISGLTSLDSDTIGATTSVTAPSFVGALTGNASTATILATGRLIYGNSFNGSADLTQIIGSAFGGTGNGFAKFSGPSATEKTFTLPNFSAAILTDNAAVTIAQGGTGQVTANAALNALLPTQTGQNGKYLTTDGTDSSWASNPLGTVTSVSVVSANGFAGIVATSTTTPAITLTTSITGLLKGNGTAISAATAGTDYVTASSTNTFTNKTYDTAGSGNAFAINGTAITAISGSGAVALTTSPIFTTPNIGSATGSISGNAATATLATTATNVTTAQASTNASYFPLFAASSTNSNQAVNLGTGLSFNPSTNTLSTTTFAGSFSGTVTNATNIGITNDTTTDATMYPLWATANSGNLPAKVSSTKLSFNPSTGTLTTTALTCINPGGTTIATLGDPDAVGSLVYLFAKGNTAASDGGILSLVGFNKQSGSLIQTHALNFVHEGAGADNKGAFVLQAVNSGISLAEVLRVSSASVVTATTFSGALSGNATTATALANGRTIAITGDLTYTSPSFDGSGNVTAAGTLATVNSNVGSFGSATQASVVTVNAKGLVTAASNATITPAVGSITGLGTGVATALGVNVGSAGAFVTFNGALGTPASGVATNLTGTAAGLTAGTVTTNANLTGVITSSGNATSIASQTGTGTKFVVDNGPTLIAPILGVASATSLATSAASPFLLTNGQLATIALTTQTMGSVTLTIPDFASINDEFTFKTKAQTMSNKTLVSPALGTPLSGVLTNCTGTASGLTAGAVTGLSITGGKTLTVSNTLTFTGTDSSSVAFGTGGTVAYTGAANTTAPNLVINGNFAFNQWNDGTGTTIADDVYCIDRFYALTQTNTISTSQQSLQENGTATNIRLTQTQAGAQRMGLATILEAKDSQPYRGATLSESLRIRCSSAQAIRYAILEWTGSADAVTSDVVNDWTSSTYTAGNFFLAANLTVTAVGSITPSANTWTTATTLTGTAGSSVNNLIVFVWTEGTAAQNVTLDIARVKLENGSTSTLFIPDEQTVLADKCTRYYRLMGVGMQGVAYSTTGVAYTMPFVQRMRIAPAATLIKTAVNFEVPGTSDTLSSGSSIASSVLSDQGASVAIDGYTALIALRTGYPTTADWLGLNSEL